MDKARRNVKTASQVLVPNASGLKITWLDWFKFVATMGIGTGCQIHLKADWTAQGPFNM